ncbi:MAG: carboxypeptidase regulatory-like domain-containing protein [Planctomycetes bacterium]|nr:carboxypeptidase regulatory-like domain-containing protein [Planctomycetota bacterium]
MRFLFLLFVGLALAFGVLYVAHDGVEHLPDQGWTATGHEAPAAVGSTSAVADAASDSRSLVATMPIGEYDVRASLPPTSLRGRVVDRDGVPLPGATITITHSGSAQENRVVADAAGAYVVEGCRAVDATLSASLDGYVTTGAGVRTVNLVAGDVESVEDLVLSRPIALRGVVVDDDGHPIAGADVDAVVASRTYDRGTWDLPEHMSFATRTDTDGRFTFDIAPEPFWTLTIRADGALVETYVDLDALRSDLVVALPVLREYSIEVVDDATGAPIDAFSARADFHGDRAAPDSAGLVTEPTTDMRRSLLARRTGPGRLEFGARVDATFDLGAVAPGYSFCDVSRLPASTGHVVARLTRDVPKSLRVRVLGEDGAPLVGRGVALFSRADGGCGLEMDPHGFRVADRATDARGEVTFEIRSDGPFQAMLDHEPHPAARTDWVTWNEATSDTPLVIRVEPAAKLCGRILLGGEPIAASVDLRITRDDGWERKAYSDRDGVYATPALAPGRYRVAPYDADPAQMNAVEVELLANQVRTLDVELTASGCGAIAGTVRFDGRPAAGIVVGVPVAGEAVTDANGAYVFAGIPVGPTIVELRRAYEHAAVRAVEVVSGRVTRLDLDLATARARGRVLHARTREPIVEAFVTLIPLDPDASSPDIDRFESFTTTLESGPDGRWTTAAIECGDYVLTVEPFVDSRHAATAQLVRVRRDGPEILTLLDAPASIVMIVPPDSGADTIAEARRLDAPWRAPRCASRDSNGAIALEALDAGAWTVTLWSVDDEDRRTLVHDFGTVTVAAGETRTLDPPR